MMRSRGWLRGRRWLRDVSGRVGLRIRDGVDVIALSYRDTDVADGLVGQCYTCARCTTKGHGTQSLSAFYPSTSSSSSSSSPLSSSSSASLKKVMNGSVRPLTFPISPSILRSWSHH